VPWAGPNTRHTSDFENVVAWLAQRMDKTSIGRLLRCSWEAAFADRAVVKATAPAAVARPLVNRRVRPHSGGSALHGMPR